MFNYKNIMKLKVLSLHWGLSIGGIGQYTAIIDRINDNSNVKIKNICIVSNNRQIDNKVIEGLANKTIISRKKGIDISWLMETNKEFQKWKPTLILTHGFNGHFIALFLKVVFNIKVPIVCSYHGLYHAATPFRKLLEKSYNLFTEWVIRNRAIGTIAVAEFSKQYLISKGVDSEKIKVIHNGIEDCQIPKKTRLKLRQGWGVDDSETLIGIASRLDPVKGISYLVDSFIKLAPKYKNIKLILVGAGTLDSELKSKVSTAGLDNRIIFTGFRTDIKKCLSAFDIFVLPSLAESHSIALLEAMRAGKAIVATNVGGNTESTRNEKEALIVPPANSDAITEAIERLLKDASLRVRLGQNARQRFLKYFTIDQTIKKTAKWFINCSRSI